MLGETGGMTWASSCHLSAQPVFWVTSHKLTCPTLRNGICIFKETCKTRRTNEWLSTCDVKIFLFQNASLRGSLMGCRLTGRLEGV